MTVTDFCGKTHCHWRIAVMAAQAPLGPCAGPCLVGVGIPESNLALLMSTHFMTGKAGLIINCTGNMAGGLIKITARAHDLATSALGITVTACTCSTVGNEAVFMTVTAHTVIAHFMVVICRAVVGVVRGLGMAGLTDPVPRRIGLVKSIVCGFFLEDSRIIRTGHTRRVDSSPDQMEIVRVLPLEIRACATAMGIMTGATFKHSIAAMNGMIGYVTKGTCRTSRIVTGLADGLFVLIVNIIIASQVQGVTVFADNTLALIMRRIIGQGQVGHQHHHDTYNRYVTGTCVHRFSYFGPHHGIV